MGKTTGRLRFTDVFDVEEIQSIQDAFAAATGVASLITEPDGTPITRPSNFCRLCNDIIRTTETGRANCCKSDAAVGGFDPTGPTVGVCMSGGLWDAGATISAGGEHVAHWLVGQVRDEGQDVRELLPYADAIGADRGEFAAALAEVPTMSRERFELVAQALFSFAKELSVVAHQNVQQARFIAENAAITEALSVSERKYRTLTEGITDVVWVLDTQAMRFTYMSPSVHRLRGFTSEEIVAAPFDEALTPNSAEAMRVFINKRMGDILSGKEPADRPYTTEIEQPRKDGSTVWTEVVAAVRFNEETGLPEIHGVTRDITERRQAEATVREGERWLSESQRIAQLGHYIFDIPNDSWTGSPMLGEVLGVGETAAGDFESWIEIVHPDDRERLSHYFTDEVLGQHKPFDLEYRIVRPCDGVERWVHGLGSVKRAEDDTPLEMFGIIQDITERKQTEAELTRREVRLAELLAERERHLERLHASLAAIIDVTSQVVETRDPYTAGHQRRVSELAVCIAQEMGMTAEQTEEIRVASLIHDVGKMSVPAEILSKPGKLMDIEFALIKRHAEDGYRIIDSANMEGPTAEIVYQHHERCDGSGYPRGLTAEELLAESKVVMVADVVEAMVSHRPYRAGLGIDAALDEIQDGAGGRYDARVAEACVRVFLDGGFAFSAA